jgi:hypothetical protein
MYINLAPHTTSVAKTARVRTRRMVGRIFLPFMSLYPVVPVAILFFLPVILLFCFWIFLIQLWEFASLVCGKSLKE